MNATRDLAQSDTPLDQPESSGSEIPPTPALSDLSVEASGHIVRYIVTSTPYDRCSLS